jgi:arabinofuranosyltransferase
VSVAPLSLSATPTGGAQRLTEGTLFVLFGYVFLANAWLGDDAYITFRVVWNFVNGYGLTFNPDERVQAFTHPLWMLTLAGAHALTREFFFTVTAVCWATSVAAGAILVRWAGAPSRAALLVGWLLSSKALVDYTGSGLENPLSYLLVALFYTRYFRRPAAEPPQPQELRWFTLVAALGFLNRPDAVLIFAVPLGEMAVRGLRAHGTRALRPLAVGGFPAVLWLVFATFYYGFPLPNTYYAKVANGIPRPLMLQQGMAYLLNSIRWDPITLGTVGLAALASLGSGARRGLAASASALLYVAYTISVGGDFMSGRFFTMPFLVSALVVVPEIGALGAPWAAAGLVLYNLLTPLAPVKTTASYDGAWPWRSQNGIKDERGHYHRATNVLFYSPFRELPDLVFAREGRSFREAPGRAAVHGSIGMFGLFAGPAKHVIDRNALSDPLLARLPVSPRLYFEFYAGHYFRDLPPGYLESAERNENLLQEPRLREYYDALRNVTRGPLWRADRLRDLWALNLGRYRRFHEDYEKRRPIELSVRADNERFETHVGVRDPVAGTLRTTGTAGFLQYGPQMPLKAGAYRARWVGVLQAAPGTESGFVDVSIDGVTSLKRVPLIARGDASGPLSHVDFTIAEPVDAIELRLWVDAGASLTLQRVELYSAFALPPEWPGDENGAPVSGSHAPRAE